jgi:hypothetical protein
MNQGGAAMLFRLKLALIVVGCVLAFVGAREFIVSSGTTSKPATVQLADLESGAPPPNNHLQIGPHTALYPASVYAYEQAKNAEVRPGPESKVQYCFYPIISDAHPFHQALAKLEQKYGGLQNVPETEPEPEIATFAVLVKTRRFPKIGAIPDAIANPDSVEGLVINQIDSLTTEESKLVQESFPRLDLTKVLILEEGRRPAPLYKSLGMVTGGAALVAAGAIMFIVKRGRAVTS